MMVLSSSRDISTSRIGTRMLATVVLILGVVTGLLGILDLLLTEQQKEKVGLWTLRTWSKLDDTKTKVLVAWSNRPNYRIWLVTAGCVISLFFAIFYLLQNKGSQLSDEVNLAPILAVSYILGSMVGRLIVSHILFTGSLLKTYVRVFLYTALIVIAVVSSTIYAAYEIIIMRIHVHLFVDSPDYVFLYFSMILALTMMIAAIFSTIAAAPLVAITAAQLTLFTLELFARKIAESSKGIVLAVSTIITGIGAVLKAFT
jgi:hypothetical protein